MAQIQKKEDDIIDVICSWLCCFCCLFDSKYNGADQSSDYYVQQQKKRRRRRKKRTPSSDKPEETQSEATVRTSEFSVPEQLTEEEIIVRSFVSVMSEGIAFQMILNDGRSKTVRLYVDDNTLTWRNTSPPYAGGVLQMTDVFRVIDGVPPDIESLVGQDEPCCFTVETHRKGSLVFSAYSPVEREAVVEGFTLLLEQRDKLATLTNSPMSPALSIENLTHDDRL